MPTDYTVIQAVRQRFGDAPGPPFDTSKLDRREWPIEYEAPFVGASKDFPFSCPAIDGSKVGVLQFNALGVSSDNNVIQVNGVDVPGGISVGPVWLYHDPHPPLWNTHSLLVEGLREDNVLHIEAGDADIFAATNLDDFIIDNVVIWFKTRTGDRPPVSDQPTVAPPR